MKKPRTRWLFLAWVGIGGILLTGWPGSARALDLYGIKVTPSISYTGEFDDNVFRTPSDKLSDYANHFIPAITLEATPDKHDIKASFSADIIRYSNHTNLDTERYLADLSGIFRFNRLELRAKEGFAHTDSFPSSELTTRIKRNENYLTGGFDYDMIRLWGLGFDFTWGNIHYLESDFDFLSENVYTFAPNVYYRVTAKTRVFAEYNFVQERFTSDTTRDNNRQRGLLGVRGDLTERFSVTAKAGYEHLDFRLGTPGNQDNIVAFVEASYRPVDRLQMGLVLKRDVETSSFANNPQYEVFNATLGMTYAITPKILIIPRASIELDTFPDAAPKNGGLEKRRDYLYGAGIGVRYDLQKWIRLEANYDFQRRDSNFNEVDYSDNRVAFTITLSL